jgi:hypothetical protein
METKRFTITVPVNGAYYAGVYTVYANQAYQLVAEGLLSEQYLNNINMAAVTCCPDGHVVVWANVNALTQFGYVPGPELITGVIPENWEVSLEENK